jgi:hypothetical protein
MEGLDSYNHSTGNPVHVHMFLYVVLEHYAHRSRVLVALSRRAAAGWVYMHALFLATFSKKFNLRKTGNAHAQQKEADCESVCGYPRG